MLRYILFSLKRDRAFLLLWFIGIIGLTLLVAPMLDGLFSTQQERLMMAETMKNPAMIALCGPCYDFDNYSNGAMMGQMMLVWSALLVALMNIFFVDRHTRKDEEEGRLELIRTLPIHKVTPMISTIALAFIINLVLSLVMGVSLGLMGIEDMDMAGSLLYGMTQGACGFVFAGVTALAAQFFQTSRGVLASSMGVLGFMFVLRAYGDMSNETASLISPLGLICRTEVYVNDYWYPIWICLAVGIVLAAAAFVLNTNRDMGQGLLPMMPGRRYASHFLRSPLSLTIKLLRNQMIAWIIVFLLLGASYGSIFNDIETFIKGNDMMQMVFASDGGANFNYQFISTLMTIMTVISIAAVLIIMFKLRSEEKSGHLEFVISNSVSKPKLLLSYTVIALVLSAIFQLSTAAGMWSAAYIVMDDPVGFAAFAKSAFVYIPAMMLFIGLAALFIGLIPRLTNIVWLYLGYTFFVVYIGKMLELPEWAVKITPLGATPQILMDDMNWTVISVLVVLSIVFALLGLKTFRQRDIIS